MFNNFYFRSNLPVYLLSAPKSFKDLSKHLQDLGLQPQRLIGYEDYHSEFLPTKLTFQELAHNLIFLASHQAVAACPILLQDVVEAMCQDRQDNSLVAVSSTANSTTNNTNGLEQETPPILSSSSLSVSSSHLYSSLLFDLSTSSTSSSAAFSFDSSSDFISTNSAKRLFFLTPGLATEESACQMLQDFAAIHPQVQFRELELDANSNLVSLTTIEKERENNRKSDEKGNRKSDGEKEIEEVANPIDQVLLYCYLIRFKAKERPFGLVESIKEYVKGMGEFLALDGKTPTQQLALHYLTRNDSQTLKQNEEVINSFIKEQFSSILLYSRSVFLNYSTILNSIGIKEIFFFNYPVYKLTLVHKQVQSRYHNLIASYETTRGLQNDLCNVAVVNFNKVTLKLEKSRDKELGADFSTSDSPTLDSSAIKLNLRNLYTKLQDDPEVLNSSTGLLVQQVVGKKLDFSSILNTAMERLGESNKSKHNSKYDVSKEHTISCQGTLHNNREADSDFQSQVQIVKEKLIDRDLKQEKRTVAIVTDLTLYLNAYLESQVQEVTKQLEQDNFTLPTEQRLSNTFLQQIIRAWLKLHYRWEFILSSSRNWLEVVTEEHLFSLRTKWLWMPQVAGLGKQLTCSLAEQSNVYNVAYVGRIEDNLAIITGLLEHYEQVWHALEKDIFTLE